jgi:CxxC motif-containing protein
MAIEREFICTACPKGCRLRVVLEGKDVVKMEGYTCRKGLDYGRQEISDPRRMLATTVRVENGFHPLLPVYTQKPISKDKIEAVLAALRELRLKAPVKAQSVVLADVAGTGVDVLASRDMPTAGE